MKNILVPISFSETSKNALNHAYCLAKEHGATLSLLHCYPIQDYNREYDFGKLDYDKGIKQMLVDFYAESIGDNHKQAIKLLIYAGSVSEIISEISHKYELLVLSRRTGFQSKSNKWLSDKISYFITKSLCPVLIISTKRDYYSFTEIKNIWHIQRKDIETDLIKQELLKLEIDSNLVVSKSLQQKTFTSAFWQNIVNYTKNHKDGELKKISESFSDEHIDLLIFVNHKKGIFEKFLKDDVFQIISQFDIPILVLQSKNTAI